MILAHNIALDPNDAQRRYFAKASGVSRFVWNLAIEECERRLALGDERAARNKALKKSNQNAAPEPIPNDEKLDAFKMTVAFNEFKNDAFPWMSETHRDCYSRPFLNAEKAWKAYFKDPKNTGRPKFHKKGRCKDSFYVANDQMIVDGRRVRLPRVGWVRMRSELRFDGKVMGAQVFRTAQRWFIGLQVDVGGYKKRRLGDGVIGVDVGVDSALTLSTGEKIKAPRPLYAERKKMRRLRRKQFRQTLGGKNRAKTNWTIARIHARCANIHKDFWHKVTTRLCRENQAIGIETLNIKGMRSNRRLSRALEDVAPGMMAPMLEYKSKIYDNVIHKTDMWFASSKTCSHCGYKKKRIDWGERVFRCDACGLVEDRDMNAAKNEENELKKFLASSDAKKVPPVGRELNACGLGMLVKAPREAGSFVGSDPAMGRWGCNTAGIRGFDRD